MNDPTENVLRAERDRFVGFAFAAADLLVEIDDTGTIRFASGTIAGLTSGSRSDLEGRKLLSIIAPQERGLARELISLLDRGNRFQPARVCLNTGASTPLFAFMGGCRLPSAPGRTFLSFSLTSLSATGPAPMPRTAPGANRPATVPAKARKAEDQKLTMLVVKGLAGLRARSDAKAVDTFLEKLSLYLRASSPDGRAPTALGEDKLAVVPGKGADGDRIREGVQKIVDQESGDSPLVDVTALTINLDAGDLSEADAVRALIYAIDKFTTLPQARYTVAAITKGAQAILDETLPRVADLRATIEHRAFDVVFQPIVDLTGEKVHHFEALTRIENFESPGELMAFAEQLGMAGDFDLAVCQKVMEMLSEQARAGHDARVAVNLSARSLESNLFIDELERVIAPFGNWNRRLMFELTETVKVGDIAELNKKLQMIRRGGQKICLDDVGASSTSFESLHGLQVDFVKIDGRQVRGAIADARHLAVLKSIVDVCRELDVETIAEHIEDERAAAVMRGLGIRFGQGYHFGRPAPELGDARAKSAKSSSKSSPGPKRDRVDWV